jgi:hypothetical protein
MVRALGVKALSWSASGEVPGPQLRVLRYRELLGLQQRAQAATQ